MKDIETLNLKKEFEGHPTITKKFMLKTFGDYDQKHYKKYWLNGDFDRFYKNHDASYLALKEASKDELKQLQLKNNTKVELVTKPISEYFEIVSHMSQLADFEEDKYNYYSVSEESRKYIHWYTVRVLK